MEVFECVDRLCKCEGGPGGYNEVCLILATWLPLSQDRELAPEQGNWHLKIPVDTQYTANTRQSTPLQLTITTKYRCHTPEIRLKTPIINNANRQFSEIKQSKQLFVPVAIRPGDGNTRLSSF